jgi:hypothetical protein
VDPVRFGSDPGFYDQTMEKKITTEKNNIFLLKHAINFSIGLHEGPPSNRRSFQRKTSSTSNMKFLNFFHFSLLDPDLDPADRINADPDPLH